jgi:hypothetical protein
MMRRPRKDRGNKRKNPIYGLELPKEMYEATANIAVTAALRGATFAERMLVAVLIPQILQTARTVLTPEAIARLVADFWEAPDAGEPPAMHDALRSCASDCLKGKTTEQPLPRGKRRTK